MLLNKHCMECYAAIINNRETVPGVRSSAVTNYKNVVLSLGQGRLSLEKQ